MAAELIKSAPITFGADPELFLEQGGKIIGSEKLIPAEGAFSEKTPNRYDPAGPYSAAFPNAPDGPIGVIRDGVQIEINVPPTHCREWMALELRFAFAKLKKLLDEAADKKFSISFRQVVEVEKAELDSLAKESRRLGCAPSFNYYEPNRKIEVNPDTFLQRSAGGHIHLGLPAEMMPHRPRLAPILDIILGNTCVMIDRDDRTAERRAVYGRAGEFRMPRHGIEYRTLSNFWLRHEVLVSFVLGMARTAIYILDTTIREKARGGWDAEQALYDLVDIRRVEKAINTGNVELAKENYLGVREFIKNHITTQPGGKYDIPLIAETLPNFDRFIAGIDKGGIESWFPDDPMTHWTGKPSPYGKDMPMYSKNGGFEYFLARL